MASSSYISFILQQTEYPCQFQVGSYGKSEWLSYQGKWPLAHWSKERGGVGRLLLSLLSLPAVRSLGGRRKWSSWELWFHGGVRTCLQISWRNWGVRERLIRFSWSLLNVLLYQFSLTAYSANQAHVIILLNRQHSSPFNHNFSLTCQWCYLGKMIRFLLGWYLYCPRWESDYNTSQ